jgi:hypothetical protein
VRARTAAALLLEVVVWSFAIWLLTAPVGEPLTPRAWHHTAEVCRNLAFRFGRLAIRAERNYWKAVRT